MPIVIEHIIHNYLKVTYICEEGVGEVIGDIPGGPFCFEKYECVEESGQKVCLTAEIPAQGITLRFEGAKIFGELRTIRFIAYGVKCDADPIQLYTKAKELLQRTCGENIYP